MKPTRIRSLNRHFNMLLKDDDAAAFLYLIEWHQRFSPKVALSDVVRDALHTRAEMVARSDASYGTVAA